MLSSSTQAKYNTAARASLIKYPHNAWFILATWKTEYPINEENCDGCVFEPRLFTEPGVNVEDWKWRRNAITGVKEECWSKHHFFYDDKMNNIFRTNWEWWEENTQICILSKWNDVICSKFKLWLLYRQHRFPGHRIWDYVPTELESGHGFFKVSAP